MTGPLDDDGFEVVDTGQLFRPAGSATPVVQEPSFSSARLNTLPLNANGLSHRSEFPQNAERPDSKMLQGFTLPPVGPTRPAEPLADSGNRPTAMSPVRSDVPQSVTNALASTSKTTLDPHGMQTTKKGSGFSSLGDSLRRMIASGKITQDMLAQQRRKLDPNEYETLRLYIDRTRAPRSAVLDIPTVQASDARHQQQTYEAELHLIALQNRRDGLAMQMAQRASAHGSPNKPGSRPIDLTADDASDDSDEVKFSGVTHTMPDVIMDVRPVCIGQLETVVLIMYSDLEELRPAASATINKPALLPVRLLRGRDMNGKPTLKVISCISHRDFGVVDVKVSEALAPLLTANTTMEPVTPEAWVVLSPADRPAMLQMNILLLTPSVNVTRVGNYLSERRLTLSHPTDYNPALHGGARYSNPHSSALDASRSAQQRREDIARALAGGRGNQTQAARTIEVKREQIDNVFKGIQSGLDLGEVQPVDTVVTPLYPHQKQALSFMLDREMPRACDVHGQITMVSDPALPAQPDSTADQMISLWRPRVDAYNRLTGWTNAVTDVEVDKSSRPPQTLGSILADDMGLGKTIVIIALIAHTLASASQWANAEPTANATDDTFDAVTLHPTTKIKAVQPDPSRLGALQPVASTSSAASVKSAKRRKKKAEEAQGKRSELASARLEALVTRSRATLIVCPLSTVQNWESQIAEHTKRSSAEFGKAKSAKAKGLSVYIYHGNNRTQYAHDLADHDIVITTYSILATEYSRQGLPEDDTSSSSDDSVEIIESMAVEAKKEKAKARKRKRKAEGKPSVLQQVEWYRIVLDEAHMIKEHSTIQARACCDLAASRRACLTGTPLQNTLNDLFSLLRFLRLEPFTERHVWNTYIGSLVKNQDPIGIARLQVVMRHLALRRTKETKDKDGQPILRLPIKKDEIRYFELDEKERAFYATFHRKYQRDFASQEASDTLLKNYCHILQELLRLRQICAHMSLVRDSEEAGPDGVKTDLLQTIADKGLTKDRALRLFASMREDGVAQCAECGGELLANVENGTTEDAEQEPKTIKRTGKKIKATSADETIPIPVLTRCQHLFCIACFRKTVPDFPHNVKAETRAACSVCSQDLSPVLDAEQVQPDDLISMFRQMDLSREKTDKQKRKQHNTVEHSTKTRALLADLFPFSQANPTSANYAGDGADFSAVTPEEEDDFRPHSGQVVKSVVFSQWTALLDRTEDALKECGIKFRRLDGSMNRDQRSRSMEAFRLEPDCEVLLVSLRAGGVGLNLTAAQRVYLLEPFWNPAVENQAVDRIYRLGQTRPVKISRFIIKDSIEANMLIVQKRKTELANLSMTQTVSKAELAKRRVEDLRTLLK
ncbi:uncharacterized protein L969DRAFT_91492 [Mixia osmundae IAM 14324]|uniref:Uncharacterized protein n=1 Tax=Mixia osmundae (strain CBS 9802 / IAM 14324 / JCM 22182 / KY 12970) TaxID=764103 RepID=G7E0L4_MIXOS|nr:uncharacterized protein L969DRAFT_91492 [Mixia osmundae IAM 14324]KEI42026.1 hypothetical protein L969DRAFT_91492 [Mixia osmundae IAM 14324]GAA96374.1 hypothetical protein E5Q_03040 [Mixia osmundae IAM 14324]